MRTNTDFFDEFNSAAQKELRLVMVIDFPTPLVLTSHAGIPNIPAGAIDDVLRDVSSLSQRLIPDEGRSEIGSMSFGVIDVGGAISDRFRTEQDAGEGLKGRKVQLYRGGVRPDGVATDWTQFRIEQTQEIDRDVTFQNGAYKISCADIQRKMRRDIFDLAKTRLAATFAIGADVLTVFDTAKFSPCDHVASFGDQPIGSFFYLKIKYQNGFEIVRATGKTATTFTGCVRGVFGTDDVLHTLPAGSGPTTGIEVEEYAYLELPAPAMAAALLTGNIPGGGTIPPSWSLGIDAEFIDQPSFNEIGTDWFVQRSGINNNFDTGDDSGWNAGGSNAGAVVNAGVDARSGVWVMEVPAAAGGPNRFSDKIPIVSGETLHVRGFAKSRNTPTGDGRISVRFFDSVPAQISNVNIGLASPGDTTFKEISGSVVAPANSETCVIDLGETTGTVGEYWYDDLSFHVESDFTKGLIFRFQSITKTDGKRFIEREVCLLAGAFLLIKATGAIAMRRMTGVVESADFVLEINPDVAIAHGPVKHDLSKVRNTFDISWSWLHFPGESKPRFVRRDILIDATSIAIHGEAKALALQFRGLHNERHTFTTLINRFDALRDRYAGPPLRLRVDLLPRLNDLEIGDIVRAVFPNVRDYAGAGTLKRSFEIQRISINQQSGRVTAELFGSSLKADPIVDDDAGATSELPNAWYASEGTAADLSITIVANAMTVNGTLAGGTDKRIIFFHEGNLTINSGVTLTITSNVELRVRGLLQINGTITASGGGRIQNVAGFIGTTFGGRGVLVRGPDPGEFPGVRVVGQNAAMPVLEIENAAGVLVGIPPDMRGSGGGKGGGVLTWEPNIYVPDGNGGNGGAGGGSIVTVSRGVAYGVAGETIISGVDGLVGVSFGGEDAGSGGGGAPGTLIHMLDGRTVLFPILFGNVKALYGTSPILNANPVTQGKAKASDPIDLGVSNARVQYVPASRLPYPEFINTEINDRDGNSIIVAQVYLRKATPPATPIVDDGSFNFSNNVLTPPSIAGGSADDWSGSVPAGADPLYVCNGTFQIQGITGTDSTVTWTAPVILASDGADGATGPVGGDGNSVHVGSVFLRKATAPTTPIVDDGSYNFTTNTLTPPSIAGGSADDWSTTVPAGTDPLYVCQGTFEVNGVTGTDSTVIWTAPVILASDGATGGAGNSVHVGQVFLRKATAPTLPIADDGSYNFSTNVLTPPSIAGGSADDWSVTVPVGSLDLYVCQGTFEVTGTTGTDSTVTWSTPVILASDGEDGATGPVGGDGKSVHVANVFLRKATAPTTPIDDDGAYNFSTNVLTPPSIAGGSADDWSITVPAGADPLRVSVGTFEVVGTTGTDSTVTWSAPVILASDGATGPTGGQGETGQPGSDALNSGRRSDDFNLWWSDDTQATVLGSPWAITQPAAPIWPDSFTATENNSTSRDSFSERMAIQLGKKYRVSIQAAQPIGDRRNYLLVAFYDSAGAHIVGSTSDATGWEAKGTYHYHFSNTAFPVAFTKQEAEFGGDSGRTIPTNAVTFAIGALMIRDGPVGTNTTVQWQDHHVIEVADGGTTRDVKFQRSATVPATPTGDDPAGWTDDIPAGVDAIYQITGLKTAGGTLIGVWSTPIRIQGITFRGAYSATTAYLRDDIVTFQERSYICVLATTGNDPSGTNGGNTWWDLIAGKGDPGDPPTPFNETIVVPSGGPANLRTLANAQGYSGNSDATITFTVAPAAVITGNAGGGAGIDTGPWPTNVTINLTLENDGIIRGGGGPGGNGGDGPSNGFPGGTGGDAITCQEDLVIDNAPLGPGVIEAAGGGGGGGGGGSTDFPEPITKGGGGGGGGFPNGAGGLKGGAASDGNPGTTSSGGLGGDGEGVDGGDGGTGGNVNANGLNGGAGTGPLSGSAGSGGVRGFAVRKNGHIVTVTGGTVTGDVG